MKFIYFYAFKVNYVYSYQLKILIALINGVAKFFCWGSDLKQYGILNGIKTK